MNFYSSYWQVVTPKSAFHREVQTLSWSEELPRKETWMPSRDTCNLAAGCSARCLRHFRVRGPWESKAEGHPPSDCATSCFCAMCKAFMLPGLHFCLWDGISSAWCEDDKIPSEPRGSVRVGEGDSCWLLVTKVWEVGFPVQLQTNSPFQPLGLGRGVWEVVRRGIRLRELEGPLC